MMDTILFILFQTQILSLFHQTGFEKFLTFLLNIFWIGVWVALIALLIKRRKKNKLEEQRRTEAKAKRDFEEYQKMVKSTAREDHYSMTKDKLSELQRLYEEGILTQEEYQKAKAKLLDEI